MSRAVSVLGALRGHLHLPAAHNGTLRTSSVVVRMRRVRSRLHKHLIVFRLAQISPARASARGATSAATPALPRNHDIRSGVAVWVANR